MPRTSKLTCRLQVFQWHHVDGCFTGLRQVARQRWRVDDELEPVWINIHMVERGHGRALGDVIVWWNIIVSQTISMPHSALTLIALGFYHGEEGLQDIHCQGGMLPSPSLGVRAVNSKMALVFPSASIIRIFCEVPCTSSIAWATSAFLIRWSIITKLLTFVFAVMRPAVL